MAKTKHVWKPISFLIDVPVTAHSSSPIHLADLIAHDARQQHYYSQLRDSPFAATRLRGKIEMRVVVVRNLSDPEFIGECGGSKRKERFLLQARVDGTLVPVHGIEDISMIATDVMHACVATKAFTIRQVVMLIAARAAGTRPGIIVTVSPCQINHL